MPMTPRCQPSPPTTSTVWAPMSGSVSTAFFAAATMSCSSLLAARVLGVELLGEGLRLAGQRLVGRQQQPRGDVGAAHAAGGVHARRHHEGDVIAVDGLAGQARRHRAAPAGRPCAGPRVSSSRPSLAMTRFSPTSGTTSASVPMAAILTNAGSQLLLPGLLAERLHELERHADAGQVLVGIRAVGALGIDDRERLRQLDVGLVVVGDDEVDAELARRGGRPRRRGCRSRPRR